MQKSSAMIDPWVHGLVLTSGRGAYLARALESIAANSVRPATITLINDSAGPLNIVSCGDIPVREIATPELGRGHWAHAFRAALENIPEDAKYFFVLHDDDELKSDYIARSLEYLRARLHLQAVSCSLETMDDKGKSLGDEEFIYRETELADSDAVLEHYCEGCIPFSATFYRREKHPYASYVERDFGSFAGGLFFAQLANHGPIGIQPNSLYRYRKHSMQVSALQSRRDEFAFLAELIKRSSPGNRARIRAKVVYRTTQTSLNDWVHQRLSDTWREQKNAGLPLSLQLVLKKPRLVWRALLTLARSRREDRAPSGAESLLEVKAPLRERLSLMVFSMDRPLQLDALLRSIFKNGRGSFLVHILWKASSPAFARAYEELRERHPLCVFIQQMDFETDVRRLLLNLDSFVAFCTDDSLFFDTFDLEPVNAHPDLICFSCRLGLNTNYSYPMNASMRHPDFFCNQNILLWKWEGACHDFEYPMSLDGHIFKKDFLVQVLEKISFGNPNQLEDVMHNAVRKGPPRWMASYRTSRYVSNPINRVQTTFPNRSGTLEDSSALVLLDKFNEGLEIHLEKTVNSLPTGAHQEYRLNLNRKLC